MKLDIATRYEEFISTKLAREVPTGMAEVPELHPSLFPHQRDLVAWALRRGRCAIFAATGLGKSRIEAEYAYRVAYGLGCRVLMLAPLAVAHQTVREAASMGITVEYVREQSDVRDDFGIYITNYDRLHRFDPSSFAGVVLDESSIIKHHNAKTLQQLLDAFSLTPWRLCATATPAPNDYTELGTHAEFLGICKREEMLSEFFVHDGGNTQDWRLKGHARKSFWAWVATWGALVRSPADLGHDASAYELPPLHVTQHTIPGDIAQAQASGTLFPMHAQTLAERRAARRGSVSARVEACVATVSAETDEQWLIWCELNDESSALAKAIPGAVEIRGADSAEEKEEALLGFANGDVRVLVTKPSIAGWGCNFQRAARMAFVGVTDSWEACYQAVRRCWRFGQRRPVHVHVFASELEGSVVANLERKERDAQRMAEELSAATRESMRAEVRGTTRETNDYEAPSISVPDWLRAEAS